MRLHKVASSWFINIIDLWCTEPQMWNYVGVLPHSIRLALLVTFFCLLAQNVEYSKRGCQFQYRVTLSGACYVLTVEKKAEFNKYWKLKHRRFMLKLSNVRGMRYLVTACCVDEASHSICPVGPGERKLLSFSARLSLRTAKWQA
jgi:hypothetical protein